MLLVDRASEAKPLDVEQFELDGVHPRRLDRVQEVQPDLDQVRDDRPDVAGVMVGDPDVRVDRLEPPGRR